MIQATNYLIMIQAMTIIITAEKKCYVIINAILSWDLQHFAETPENRKWNW